jgi:lipoic acid synthetase
MLGLGETDDEIVDVLRDLRRHNVDMLTVGQYLQPRAGSLPVRRYVPPATFKALEDIACRMGFAHAACGPLVRSSYHADRQALAAGAS